MKNFRILLPVIAGTILFIIGLLVPLHYHLIRILLMAGGAALVLVFYFLTLLQVIRSIGLTPQRRIFWLVAIICVPVLGNLVYVIVQDALTTPQVPHPQNF